MELKDSCKLLLKKGTYQKVKCYKFFVESLRRELVLHEIIDSKGKTGVSDSITGVKLFDISKEPSKVKEEEIKEGIDKFIRHFTMEEVEKEFEKWEGITEEKSKDGRN